jgi:pantothenate kinase
MRRISTVDDLVTTVRSVHRPGRRTLLGVAGPPGAGKSRMARFVVAAAGSGVAAIVQQDGFHLRNDVLTTLGRRDRKGAPDTFDVDGFVDLLDRLRVAGDRAVAVPVFRREVEEVVDAGEVIGAQTELLVVEGNYLLLDEPPWARVAERLDMSLYVDAPAAVRRRRLLDRQRRTYGSAEAAARWVERVDEPNARIVEATRVRADVVVGGFDVPDVR